MQKTIRKITFMAFLLQVALVANPGTLLATDEFSLDGAFAEEMSLFQDIPSVFSASKYEQKVTEAPSSVSIVTADEIKKAGYRTLADILAGVRSFYISDDHNYKYIGVRGFGRPGDYNSRMLLLVDGHRVNDSLYATAPIGYDSTVDVELIERVEIIRGPSSSLYGANAFFGVINVITKRGRDFQGAEISAAIGDDNAVKGRLSYGNRFSSGFELLLSGTIDTADGQDWYFAEFDDPYYNNGLAVGIDEREAYNLLLKASYADFTLVSSYSGRDDGYPTAPWWTEFNDPVSNMLDERFYIDLKYEHITATDLEISGRIFYDLYRYDGYYPYDWADYDADPNADPYILDGVDYARGDTWGVELQTGKTLWTKHRLILGAEYRDNFTQEQDYYNYQSVTVGPDYAYINPHPLDSDEDAYFWALFAQDEYRLNDQLILNAGLRVDHYSSFGNTVNPRVALIYNPREQRTLKFLYGSSFRAPTAYELYYHDAGETTLPSPNLEPETITTYEIVWEERFANNFRTVVNAFYYEINDLISQELNVDDLLVFENLNEVEAYGIEFELEGKLLELIDTHLSYTYQESEDVQTGETLSNSPRHLAKLHITLPVWKETLFLNLEELYSSSKLTVATDARPIERLDAAYLTNLTLYAQKPIGGLDLSFSIYNLFDENYWVPGSGEHVQAAMEQAGRSFQLKAIYSF